MRLKCQIILALYLPAVMAQAQDVKSPSLNIGDLAPPLQLREWLKGTPIQHFEKGKVYVVEFWATWCNPCIAALNHLSALAHEYRDDVNILGVDIYETKSTPSKKLKAFVDTMALWQGYHLATEDSSFIVARWIEASGEKDNGIPRTFVVDAEGRVALIGYPKELNKVLPKIVNKTWDIDEALARRKKQQRLLQLDKDASYELAGYQGDSRKAGDRGKPDSALSLINDMVRNEPDLRYAPQIASTTFIALLKTNPYKAYEYGKVAIVTPTYDDPPYNLIYGLIENYSDKLNLPDGNINKLRLPAEIYELGAQAYQVEIDSLPYPELIDLSKLYYKMAEMYWCANNKARAVATMQKAIETLKDKKDFSKEMLPTLETRLEHYKKM